MYTVYTVEQFNATHTHTHSNTDIQTDTHTNFHNVREKIEK